ncbi:MAG: DUF2851 family protein, partial [Verrucomicrobiota bacterium]
RGSVREENQLLQIPLKGPVSADPWFAFEHIDETAYPYEIEPSPSHGAPLIAHWKPEEKERFLRAAGEERLRRKAERLLVAIEDRGADQALYEEIMTAFGYKNNKAPFRRLAQVVSSHRLREEAEGDPIKAYAILLGVSGLLPDEAETDWDEETRTFFRTVWDHWWKRRSRWESAILEPDRWNFSSLRPANHPTRRLMAAAHLFSDTPSLFQQLTDETAASTDELLDRVYGWFLDFPTSYWTRRYSLSGKVQTGPVALVGPSRTASILLNVILPFIAATNLSPWEKSDLLDQMPVEPMNATIKQTAHLLFGPDHPSSLYRTGMNRQGLIQVFHDFILNMEPENRVEALGRLYAPFKTN